MDKTVKFLLDKVTQLTNRFNSMSQNSKKIHELNNAASKVGVFIAVSDGSNTGKIVYEPSEVSLGDFNNLKNLQLGNNPGTSLIFIKDQSGNLLSTLDLSFLNGNNVTLNIDNATNSLQLLDFQGQVVSSVLISDLQPKYSIGLFKHILTQQDIANTVMTFTLPDIPNGKWDFLHIGSGPVNPDSYSVSGNILSVNTSLIDYVVQSGRSLTFRYEY